MAACQVCDVAGIMMIVTDQRDRVDLTDEWQQGKQDLGAARQEIPDGIEDRPVKGEVGEEGDAHHVAGALEVRAACHGDVSTPRSVR